MSSRCPRLGAHFRVGSELHRDKIGQALADASIEQRISVSVNLAVVPHVVDDVASRSETRQQAAGRMDEFEQLTVGLASLTIEP